MIDMKSSETSNENYEKLIKLFPSVVKETIDENGNIVRCIDAKELEKQINTLVVNDSEEKYEFTWPGKAKALKEAYTPITSTLRPLIDDSVDFFSTSNVYIEGDNIDALKVLQKSYSDSIKMIYIDPPYNTCNDFIYNDNFSSKISEYKDLTSSKKSDEGRFHASWLNMIYPRISLARKLLKEDGVIFISIDECEEANLKKVCNEIFGEENFINTFMWLHGKGKKDAWSRTQQQYVLSYAKDKEKLEKWKESKTCDYDFKNPDNDPKGEWFNGSLSLAEKRSYKTHKNYYKVTSPSGIVWERQWFISEEEMNEMIKNNDIYFGQPPLYDKVPRIKIRPDSLMKVIPTNIIDDCNTSHGAEKHITSLFGSKCFSYPKPYELIEKFMSFLSLDNEIVMDFFSGSATTAEAVLRHNIKKPNANTKYIMVQLPEDLDDIYKKTFATAKDIVKNAIDYLEKKDLPHTISEIGKERIKNATDALVKQYKDLDTDFGFRCFKIDSSNMASTDDTDNSFKPHRTSFDIIFQIILNLGLKLDSSINVQRLEDKYIYLINKTELAICLEDNLTDDEVEQIANMNTKICVLKDTSKEELFKQHNNKTLLRLL